MEFIDDCIRLYALMVKQDSCKPQLKGTIMLNALKAVALAAAFFIMPAAVTLVTLVGIKSRYPQRMI